MKKVLKTFRKNLVELVEFIKGLPKGASYALNN